MSGQVRRRLLRTFSQPFIDELAINVVSGIGGRSSLAVAPLQRAVESSSTQLLYDDMHKRPQLESR